MKASTMTTVLGTLSILVVSEARAASHEMSAETAFRDAKEYTVRVRTRIETPFIGDVEGSFEGAGFLVDAKRGWIVTNAHVVGRSPSQVRVAFADGSFVPARQRYVDSFADIAILELETPLPDRKTAPLTRTTPTVVGEPIGAFGHPLGIPFTGTRGIVSGTTDQSGPDLIQIDATVDHGNSGGPVISLKDGTVVGIATAGAGGDRSDRLNFATPIRDVQRILGLLRSGTSPCPPRLGFALLKDEDDRFTLGVASSFDSTRWPLQADDRIVGIEGRKEPLERLHDLVSTLRGRGDRVELTVERAGQLVKVSTRPSYQESFLERRGVSIDGAVISTVDFEDELDSQRSARLMIHSIEPATPAHMAELSSLDLLYRLDGRAFDDVEALTRYLHERPSGPLTIVVKRFSPQSSRMFDYQRRELPGEDIHTVGAGVAEAIAAKP